jgi:hypothetical protein
MSAGRQSRRSALNWPGCQGNRETPSVGNRSDYDTALLDRRSLRNYSNPKSILVAADSCPLVQGLRD